MFIFVNFLLLDLRNDRHIQLVVLDKLLIKVSQLPFVNIWLILWNKLLFQQLLDIEVFEEGVL